MPNVGPLELAIVLIIALVIFGPKRLPELGRSLGNGLKEFRSSVTGSHGNEDDEPRELEGDVDEDDVDEGSDSKPAGQRSA